jgi:hypothetical protein
VYYAIVTDTIEGERRTLLVRWHIHAKKLPSMPKETHTSLHSSRTSWFSQKKLITGSFTCKRIMRRHLHSTGMHTMGHYLAYPH